MQYVSKANENDIYNYQLKNTEKYRFIFSGFIFSNGICEVEVKSNNISAKNAYLYRLN